VLYPVEIKTPWALEDWPQDASTLCQQYKEWKASSSTVSSTHFLVLSQTVGYMMDNNSRYGVITTYNRSWFLKGDPNHNKVFISDPVHFDSSKPSVLRSFAYVWNQSDHALDGTVARLTSPQIQVEPPPPPPELPKKPSCQEDPEWKLGDDYDDEDDDDPEPPKKKTTKTSVKTNPKGESQKGSSKPQSPKRKTKSRGSGRKTCPVVDWKEIELIRVIGIGGSGTVVLSRWRGMQVALKLIDTGKCPDSFDNELSAYQQLVDVQGDLIPRLYFVTSSPSGWVQGLGLELGQPVKLSEQDSRITMQRLKRLGYRQQDPHDSNYIQIGDRSVVVDLESVAPIPT